MPIRLDKVLKTGYSNNFKQQKDAFIDDGYIYDKKLSNNYHQVYYNEDSNELLFNVNGTNPLNPADLLTDVYLGFGDLKDTTRYKESEQALKLAKNFYNPTSTTLTGHSLGGSIVSLLPSDRDNDKIIALDKGSTIGTRGRKNEIDYRTSGDIISLLTSGSKHTINLENPNIQTGIGIIDLLTAHNVSNISDDGIYI